MAEKAVVRRLLLALSGERMETARLQSLAGLAVSMEMELVALFVEDERLLRAGQLPMALEVGRISARVRPLSGPGIESSLRAAAEQVRRTLEEIAGRSTLRYTFQVARGQPVAAALAVAETMDAVLFAGRGQPIWRARREPVFAMLMPGEGVVTFVTAARRLARAVGAELILGLPADSAADFIDLRGEVEALPTPLPERFMRMREGNAQETIRVARSLNAGFVVVPAAFPAGELAALFAGLHRPLLMLRQAA